MSAMRKSDGIDFDSECITLGGHYCLDPSVDIEDKAISCAA